MRALAPAWRGVCEPSPLLEKLRVEGLALAALEILASNNDLMELQDREFAELQGIMGEFTRKLQERREDLTRAADILGEIDWAFAKGEFSRQFDSCIPEIRPERAICLNGFRHPLLRVALSSGHVPLIPLRLKLKSPINSFPSCDRSNRSTLALFLCLFRILQFLCYLSAPR